MIAADESTSQLWASPAWRTEAIGWLDRQLTAAGLARMAEPQQPRIRASSTLLRFPVDAGFVVWMKACAPQSAYEAALAQLLGRHAPGSVVPPIAVDVERGWMLSPDAGQVFRERVVPGAMLTAWEGVVEAYSRLQVQTVPLVTELLATGVPDLRPGRMAEQGSALLRDVGAAPQVIDEVQAACARLAASPVPDGLQHDDVHPGNVFLDADAHPRFFDWGDAYVGHPFASMLTGLRCLEHQHGIALGAQQSARLRATYLRPWASGASRDQLRSDLEDAMLVGGIGRVLGWRRAMAHATDAEHEQWDEHPRRWLAEVRDGIQPPPAH